MVLLCTLLGGLPGIVLRSLITVAGGPSRTFHFGTSLSIFVLPSLSRPRPFASSLSSPCLLRIPEAVPTLSVFGVPTPAHLVGPAVKTSVILHKLLLELRSGSLSHYLCFALFGSFLEVTCSATHHTFIYVQSEVLDTLFLNYSNCFSSFAPAVRTYY